MKESPGRETLAMREPFIGRSVKNRVNTEKARKKRGEGPEKKEKKLRKKGGVKGKARRGG